MSTTGTVEWRTLVAAAMQAANDEMARNSLLIGAATSHMAFHARGAAGVLADLKAREQELGQVKRRARRAWR